VNELKDDKLLEKEIDIKEESKSEEVDEDI